MYPLRLEPRWESRPWGGTRIAGLLGRPVPKDLTQVGESLELFDLPGGSRITNGPWKGRTLRELIVEKSGLLLGTAPSGPDGGYPLQVRFLDTLAPTPLEVLPAPMAKAWVILHAEPGARLIRGTTPGTTPERLEAGLRENRLEELLLQVRAKVGECYWIAPGMPHALGAGILAVEFQAPAAGGYRLSDWNRLDAQGGSLALQVPEALAALGDFSALYDGGARSHIAGLFTTVSRLVSSPVMSLERVRMIEGYEQEIPYSESVVWVVLDGQGVISCENYDRPTAFTRGDLLVLPAGMKKGRIKTITPCGWLEARIPSSAPVAAW